MTTASRMSSTLILLSTLFVATLVHADSIPLSILNCTISASNRTYDATTDATIDTSGCAAPILDATQITPGDDVTLQIGTLTGSFDTKNASTSKTVMVSGFALGGANAAKYVLIAPTTTASIFRALINASFQAFDKAYDGTTTAVIKAYGFAGVVNGDDVELQGDAQFSDKNAGTKTVALNNPALGGADAANYSLGSVSFTTAVINTRPLAVAASATGKEYDGSVSSAATLSDDRVSGDDLSISYGAAAFADAAVGTGKQVTVTGINVTGTDAGNYTWNTSTTTTADIRDTTPPQITLHGAASITLGYRASFTDDGADAIDLVDGTTTVTETGSVDTNAPGTYTLTYTSADAHGNTAQVQRTVTVSPPSANGPVSGGGGGGGAGPIAAAFPYNGGAAPTTTSAPAQAPAVVPTVLGATTFRFDHDLKVGSTGTDVTELQKILIALGLLTIDAPTGTFGPATKAAVIRFQTGHGIAPASGYVGALTRGALNEGNLPTTADEQQSLIQQLQQQIKTLMAQLAALMAAKGVASSSATSTTY